MLFSHNHAASKEHCDLRYLPCCPCSGGAVGVTVVIVWMNCHGSKLD
jgi:hypothetical protein